MRSSERPLAYLRLLGVKLLWTVQAVEMRDTHSYEFFRQASPLPALAARISDSSMALAAIGRRRRQADAI